MTPVVPSLYQIKRNPMTKIYMVVRKFYVYSWYHHASKTASLYSDDPSGPFSIYYLAMSRGNNLSRWEEALCIWRIYPLPDTVDIRQFMNRSQRCTLVVCALENSGSDKAMACFYIDNGPLTRYVMLWVAHAPGMPGTFSQPPRVSDPDMHHGMPGSLNGSFLWCRWWGKRSRHS